MRRNARTDGNQGEIVGALERVGASVHCTHMLGRGFPDLVVGFRGVNYLVEIKDGNNIPSKQKLTGDEPKFHDDWKGKIHIINSVDAALEMIGLI